MVRVKRAYEPPSREDGTRVLVEMLWPRGLSKERAAVDVWLKDVAPSAELRRWFGHEAARWDDFRRRYAEELDRRPDAVGRLRELAAAGPVTLVYGSREQRYNAAVALAEYLESAGRAQAA